MEGIARTQVGIMATFVQMAHVKQIPQTDPDFAVHHAPTKMVCVKIPILQNQVIVKMAERARTVHVIQTMMVCQDIALALVLIPEVAKQQDQAKQDIAVMQENALMVVQMEALEIIPPVKQQILLKLAIAQERVLMKLAHAKIQILLQPVIAKVELALKADLLHKFLQPAHLNMLARLLVKQQIQMPKAIAK